MTPNHFPTLVVGGGIAALLYSYYFKVPVVMAQLSPLPLCAYLHDTEEARKFLYNIGIDPVRQEVSHAVFWNGLMDMWPGSEASHRAYFEKTRKVEMEIDTFHRAKGATSQFSIARMSQVYIELYQRLKLEGLVFNFFDVEVTKTWDGKIAVMDKLARHQLTCNDLKLAMPPEAIGISEVQQNRPHVHNCYDTFKVDTNMSLQEIIYVCDADLVPYRISKLTHDMLLVEHAYENTSYPMEVIQEDLEKVLMAEAEVWHKLETTHLGRRTNFGFYERQYNLPDGVELIGRVANGNTLLTHHLIEKFAAEAACTAL